MELLVCKSKALPILFTKLRATSTSSSEFVLYAKRAMRLVAEDALAEFPVEKISIETPCGPTSGLQPTDPRLICAVSIVRSGDALLEAVRDVEPGVRVGKILIQRDESLPEKPAKLFYSKLPPGIANMHVLLCDPMLATGGSALMAMEVLISSGVDPAKVVFATMICAPEGISVFARAYPKTQIITAAVDECLNEQKYIVPGLGDYGDRFFNTCT